MGPLVHDRKDFRRIRSHTVTESAVGWCVRTTTGAVLRETSSDRSLCRSEPGLAQPMMDGDPSGPGRTRRRGHAQHPDRRLRPAVRPAHRSAGESRGFGGLALRAPLPRPGYGLIDPLLAATAGGAIARGGADVLAGTEGTFLLCTFWLADLLGNFPQALSHIGLVNAAWAISCAL